MPMAESKGEGSPEYVAYLLFQVLADVENKELRRGYPNTAHRNWVLDTFAECLDVVRNPKARVDSIKLRG
jgi:hypothetical protein